MTAPARIAVVGAGLVGQQHIGAIRRSEVAELVAVVEPQETGMAIAAAEAVPHFADLTRMLDAVAPEGVIVATPTPLHVEHGLICVAHGCPLLIEKPIAADVAAAKRLVAAAEAAGVPVLVGHHRRHSAVVREAQALIASGAIGDMRAVQATCWLYKPDGYFDAATWRTRAGAGPISVNLVHDVDLLRHLCGEVTSVQAQAAPSRRGHENEDVAAAVLTFDTGVLGTLSVSDATVGPWSWELTAHENPAYPPTGQSCYLLGGSAGALSLPDLTVWTHAGGPNWWHPMQATRAPHPITDPLVAQIAQFAEVIAGQAAPLVSGAEGLRSLMVVEAIDLAARTGETVRLEAL